MYTYLKIGVGKHIEEKFLVAKNEILIATPNISSSLSKKLINYLERGIKIKIILSESTNEQTRKSISILSNYFKKDNKKRLEIKIVDFNQASLIHAKIYIIDKKFAIIGSANLTESSFNDLPEYIIIHDDNEMVKQITSNFFEIWEKYKNQSFKHVFKKRIGKIIKRK
jgi:phosphatidylserine/phosphatidylglycerophosphate/cardiolipin synthase-like enzyme